MESTIQTPEPPPRYDGFASYPRNLEFPAGTPIQPLPLPLRLARGFLIGNYWFAGVMVVVLIAYFATGAYKEHHVKRNESYDPTSLVLIIFFVAGFLIGSLTKRQRVSVILAGIDGFLAWFIWGAVIIQMDSSPGFALLIPYTALSIFLAVLVNRAASPSKHKV